MTTDNLLQPETTTVNLLESEATKVNSIASVPQEEPLLIRDSTEPKTIDVVPAPQPPERRNTQPTAIKPEKPSMKKPINRYRTESYDAEETTLPNKTMPQPHPVRNRYKNP